MFKGIGYWFNGYWIFFLSSSSKMV